MASDLWIELAETMLQILRRIEAEEKKEDDVMIICLDCGCNAKSVFVAKKELDSSPPIGGIGGHFHDSWPLELEYRANSG